VEPWSVHQLYAAAKDRLGEQAAASLQAYSAALSARGVAVVLTLKHLSLVTGVSYAMLRDTVRRKREAANYRMYPIRKRSGGRRFIHSVGSDLLRVQKFVNTEILQHCQTHTASVAYKQGCTVLHAASRHCGCRWLIQFDLKDFFWDVTEADVFRVFLEMGYRHLFAFELARICTTTHVPVTYHRQMLRRTHGDPTDSIFSGPTMPYRYASGTLLGVLPQGAPSSPMLANLAARHLDQSLSSLAQEMGLVYTRYADDLSFSTAQDAVASRLEVLKHRVERIVRQNGFAVNPKKFRVARPGSRKIVLGLLVDGPQPRICRATRKRIEHLLYSCAKFDFNAVAANEGFESAAGLFNHLRGLLAFVKGTDSASWKSTECLHEKVLERWTAHTNATSTPPTSDC